jgi:sugar phosphate isomerase/epimerase
VPRLGVITDELSEDLDHALAVCKELGIRDIELRSVWGKSIVDHDPDSLARAREAVTNGGFSVVSIASPFLKTHISGESAPAAGNTHSASDAPRSQQPAVLERTLHAAEILDAPIVRTFSFWRIDDPESVRDDILEELQKATETVRAAGRKLGLENEHACNIATGEESRWYLDRIPDETFGLIWDPGNEAALGSNPIPNGYEQVKDRIHHIHLKDAISFEPGAGFTTIGEGAIDYVEQFRLLKRDGYDGVLSIETHFNKDGSREPATRACAAGIRRVAAEAGLTIE